MRKDYLDYGFKLFMSLAAFLFWKIQTDVREDVKEVQSDVKVLLAARAASDVEISNIKERVLRLESSNSSGDRTVTYTKEMGMLPSQISLKRRS